MLSDKVLTIIYQSSRSDNLILRATTVLSAVCTLWTIICAYVTMMTKVLSLLWLLIASGTTKAAVPISVNISYPNDTIIFHKIGILYPSINNGHLRFTVNISLLEEVSNQICSYAKSWQQISKWTRPKNLKKFSNYTRQQYLRITPNEKWDSLATFSCC